LSDLTDETKTALVCDFVEALQDVAVLKENRFLQWCPTMIAGDQKFLNNTEVVDYSSR